MLLDVINVTPKEDFQLIVTFENGEQRAYDCTQLFDKKPYEKLKNLHFFKQAHIAFGTVSWSNDIDIAPETLYFDSKEKSTCA